jgi:hypothetical protein
MIYVDGFRQPAKVAGCRPARWSHLLADDREELHAFAALIGMKREWFQDHPVRWHYDVTDTRRRQAITLGAREITFREVAAIMESRRSQGRKAEAMPDYTAAAALAAKLMDEFGWSKDAVRSCNFEMDEKPDGPHCVGRAVNIATDRLGLPFEPAHTLLASRIRAEYPEFTAAGADVDVIAEWNNHPAVSRGDVDRLLATIAS